MRKKPKEPKPNEIWHTIGEYKVLETKLKIETSCNVITIQSTEGGTEYYIHLLN